MATTTEQPETFEEGFLRVTGAPAPPINNPQLAYYWNLPVSQLCQVTVPPPAQANEWPQWQERHRLYLYLLCSLGWVYWCGYKDGRDGTYPWNDTPQPDDPVWMSMDYRGHNIVALAVDQQGRLIDFDFNHNTLFNSSAQHAEARLVKRLYGLSSVGAAWGLTDPVSSNGSTLQGFTVYTSLESCSQCSGIMALAGVENVVFMQQDPGQYLIGRILHNLTPPNFQAPLPISGNDIALQEFVDLGKALYTFYNTDLPEKPFFIPTNGGTPDTNQSITSFLCTSAARAIYFQGAQAQNGPLTYGDWAPSGIDGAYTNSEVQAACAEFVTYAANLPYRGTPHGN
jgi:tRNA(Arg) A34 adenosine deaminase TadA